MDTRKGLRFCVIGVASIELSPSASCVARSKELNWKNMKDVQFVGAMGPPGGARNAVDPRFVSLFSVFEIQFPATESLTRIFDTILNAHVQSLAPDIKVSARHAVDRVPCCMS